MAGAQFFLHTQREPVDVCIVGAGAGGAVVAKELAEAGLRVVLLDAGPRFDPSRYLTRRYDFEISAPRLFQPRDPRRDVYTWGSRHWFHYSRVKGIGGSTLVYVGVTPRFHPSDFRTKSVDGVGEDWPITYEDLEPYYTRVEYIIGTAGDDRDNPFAPPRSRPYPTPPHPFNCASQHLKRAADALGWHLAPPPVAIPSVPWNGRPNSIGCGACRLGCLIRAKGSVDVTYIPLAERTGNVEIRPNSMAFEITVDKQGRARSVRYIDENGREQEQLARVIVIAGNAVETPRLLLMSTSSLFPDGLANSSGLVGRYFMEHLAVFATLILPERVDAWKGIPAGGIIHDFYETDPHNPFARGFAIEINNGWQWPASVARRIPGWGRAHKERMREIFGRTAGLGSVGEQLPDPRNRVELDPKVKDIYGLPAPRITNEPRENDRAMIRAIIRRMEELADAAGATFLQPPRYAPGGSSHYMGTCRMGTDPATSVVNPWGQTHDVPNLFIADSSVFVTGAAVNPSLTIMALATRTAEYIVEQMRRRELP